MGSEEKAFIQKLVDATASVWDESGVRAYVEHKNPPLNLDAYERKDGYGNINIIGSYEDRLGELGISPEVKNYLLNGKSSGLSICDMTYQQLIELDTGVSALKECKDATSKEANDCYLFYQSEGERRVGMSDG